jgi:ArsR family transcriptional regulator
MEDIVQKFKALGDETRLKIFLLLEDRNVCVRGLSKMLVSANRLSPSISGS